MLGRKEEEKRDKIWVTYLRKSNITIKLSYLKKIVEVLEDHKKKETDNEASSSESCQQQYMVLLLLLFLKHYYYY